MTNELFVDGICEIDDKTIESYFSRFGSRIINYDAHRHRPTNSCCFTFIKFESHHTVNAILRQRPHTINFHRLFIKRILPPNACSFTERLLPVSSIFIYNKFSKEFNEEKLKACFNNYGKILKFQHDHIHNRIVIEYDDYDSVDRIFLNKENLPNNISIHKNILPRAQNTIEYHGTCRRKQQENIQINEKKKKKSYFDTQYQDLLQKTIEDLINCKSQLKNKENDYILLQMEYISIKEENEKLNQILDEQNETLNSCLTCQEHRLTISQLEDTLLKLNEQLISTTQNKHKIHSKSEHDTSIRRHQYSLSTRLNYDENSKHEALENCSTHSNLVIQQENTHQSRIQQTTRIKYKYNSVKSDND